MEKVETLTVLEGENSVEFLRDVFACFAERQPFAIERQETDIDRLVHTERKAPYQTTTKGWVRLDYQPLFDQTPAQVTFTSGTTGRPKPIVLSHANLADVVTRLNDLMRPTEEIREYVGVPVTYSFGIGRARAVAAAGGQIFIPERFDPFEIKKMLDDGEINALSAVPSLWRTVLNAPEILGDAGKKVLWIEIGSQLMTGIEKGAMKRIFPNAKIVQHYGLTEASRTTLLDISASDGSDLESVGRATGSVGVKIQNDAIAIRGDHVALGVLQEGGEIEPLTDTEGWLVTKDRGRLDGDLLFFEGRLDDQINVLGIKVYSEALESQVSHRVPEAVGHFAIGPGRDELRGQIILLVIDKPGQSHQSALEAAAQNCCEASGIDSRGAVETILVDELPMTGTGKIQRSRFDDLRTPEAEALPFFRKLAHRALRRRASVLEVFQAHFEEEQVSPEASFNGLGGDSLSYVTVALELEQILGGLPLDWGEMSVAELEALTGPRSWLTQIDTSTALRASAIMLIAMGHLDLWKYGGGGAFTLFMIAGWSFSAFTLPIVLSSARTAPIVVLALRIALLTLAWTTFSYLTTGWGEWPAFFFIGNWISPSLEGGAWFIAVYLQMLIVVGLAFAVPSVRRAFDLSEFRMAAGVAGICVLLAAGADALFDTQHLYRRLPHLMAWIFFCGLSAQAAKTHTQRGITTVIFLLGVFQLQNYSFLFGFFPLTGLILIWLPTLPTPYVLLKPLREIAGASLVIYLTHFKFSGIAHSFNLDQPIVGWLAAIVGGVVLWRLYEPIDILLRRRLKRLI